MPHSDECVGVKEHYDWATADAHTSKLRVVSRGCSTPHNKVTRVTHVQVTAVVNVCVTCDDYYSSVHLITPRKCAATNTHLTLHDMTS